VAARTRSRPLYTVFLERVIQIEAVQRHRAAVTDDDMAQFFSEGCPPWTFGDFLWSLDAPREAFPWSWQVRIGAKRSVSLPMQHAWNAAAAAFEEFIKALKNGELIASGVHPATGARYDLDPAEWTREWLILDVRNGELVQVEARDGWFDLAFSKKTVRWTTITVREAIPEKKLGKIDWDDWWEREVARREQGSLPNEKDYSRQTEPLIIERYGVTRVDGGDLRRFKVALYRGDSERPKRQTRKKPKHKL
jgi:hypothetical protein